MSWYVLLWGLALHSHVDDLETNPAGLSRRGWRLMSEVSHHSLLMWLSLRFIHKGSSECLLGWSAGLSTAVCLENPSLYSFFFSYFAATGIQDFVSGSAFGKPRLQQPGLEFWSVIPPWTEIIRTLFLVVGGVLIPGQQHLSD